jgi:oligoendopeptidase F
VVIVDAERWATIEPFCAALLDEHLTAELVPGWLQRWSDLAKGVIEARARLKAAAIRYPADERARRAFEICQHEVIPLWMAARQRLTEKLLAVDGFRPGPEYREMMRRFRNQDGLFSGESVALDAELSIIEGEWGQLFAGITVRVDGETLSLAAANARLADLDRLRREAAWRGINQAWLEKHEEIGALFMRALQARARLARVLAFPNYLSYRWRELDRLDYSSSDVATFLQAIEREIVPLAGRLIEIRRAKLGLRTVRPWDLAVDRDGCPPLRPFTAVEELEEGVVRMLTRVDGEIGELFQRMRGEWMDLAPRAEKPLGGEEWFFPQSGMPYIVANAVGTHTNILTVLHEMGHATHDFLSGRQHELIWNGGGPNEFEELAAGALVFLADPYLERDQGGFYSAEEARQARAANVEFNVHFLAQLAIMVSFEHWVYRRDPAGLTIEAIDQKWLELSRRFDPDVDWSGLERERMSRWQQHALFHFANPCYFITYGLSTIGAFEVWRRAQVDGAAAIAAYKQALALGDTQPLPVLYGAAGARLPFDGDTVREAADFIAGLLATPGIGQ